MELSEQQIVELCLSGNQTGQKELYTRYAERLYALLCRYCSSTDDARDMMHDCLIKALGKMDSFTYRGKGSLYAWLSRMAVNMAHDKVRRNKLKLLSLDLMPVKGNIPEPDPGEVIKIPKQALMDMISRLPEMRRIVFNMYCIDEYSHKDIAEILGITEKGSAGTLAKARAQLKAMVVEYIKKNEL
ncbi:MAG: RNA polymerase sigma factor [Bacteroidales bacterium]|nr:RNA polymerase sigma factor [Bacteroidales bacterium]